MQPFQQLRYEDVPELPRLPHPYWQSEARVLDLPQGKVEVRVFGKGPPLVLVHGLMTTSYSWRYVLPLLGEKYTLYMPDLLGAGRSEKPDARYDAKMMSESIGATIEALGLQGTQVIANSMGGYLAMRLAIAKPALMSRLVTVHAPGLATGRMHALEWLFRLMPAPEAMVRFLVQRDPERWVHKNVHYYDDTLKSREEHREYAAPLRSREGATAFARHMRYALSATGMAEFETSVRALKGQFPIPLALVYSDADPLVPPVVGKRLHALLPSAELMKLDAASHFAHVDAPERFVAAISPFLR